MILQFIKHLQHLKLHKLMNFLHRQLLGTKSDIPKNSIKSLISGSVSSSVLQNLFVEFFSFLFSSLLFSVHAFIRLFFLLLTLRCFRKSRKNKLLICELFSYRFCSSYAYKYVSLCCCSKHLLCRLVLFFIGQIWSLSILFLCM